MSTQANTEAKPTVAEQLRSFDQVGADALSLNFI